MTGYLLEAIRASIIWLPLQNIYMLPMNRIVLSLLVLTLVFTSCKSKLEKKDKSLQEMQEDNDQAKENYTPTLASANATPVFKKINDTTELHLSIYFPQGIKKGDAKPAIIYFFSGAFLTGSPAQFEPHCQYFASRGIVAIAADYRVIKRNGGNALNCIYDAKSAVRYVREHAAELNVDPNKIIVSGGSAGAFLALTCAIDDPKWQDATDNTSISCKPNAMILLNPVVNAMEHNFRIEKFKDNATDSLDASHAKEVDPLTHITAGMPPMIMFHGTADKISGYNFVEQYHKEYVAAGNQCDLISYKDQKHGFTAVKFKGGKYYRETLYKSDVFLTQLGYLSGEPTISQE